MNLVTRAEVEVQPYAFTTKSIYVGHMDYQYSRWQVIDTPGILDRPLEEMNTIELQAVTALTHTASSILFFVDISEQCGMTIENQLKTFHCLYPLFEKQVSYNYNIFSFFFISGKKFFITGELVLRLLFVSLCKLLFSTFYFQFFILSFYQLFILSAFYFQFFFYFRLLSTFYFKLLFHQLFILSFYFMISVSKLLFHDQCFCRLKLFP